jgi:uncharacterized protein
MLVDSHCHIFTQRIVENTQARPALVEALGLNAWDVGPRLDPAALQESAETNGIDACVLLPTAAPHRVTEENDRFLGFAKTFPRLRTLATLHPAMEGLDREIERLFDLGVAGFKFSSFSQRIDVLSPDSERMFTQIRRSAGGGSVEPVLVLDTFVGSREYFDTRRDHLTTPARISRLARRHPGFTFVAAHMGGLLADFDELRRDLPPAPNLFLDTSNAAHTLTADQFIELLHVHGPDHVLFGTDWPWFVHRAEVPKIRGLLARAGWDATDQAMVFGGNAQRVFGF